MESFLTKFLKKNADVFSDKINNFSKNNVKIKPNDITTVGLLLNAVALVNLLHNEFILFIIFFIMSYFCDILDGKYAKKYNMETPFGKYYDRIADWIKVMSVYFGFSCLYKNKIGLTECLLVGIILIMCNIHFSIKKNVEKQFNIKDEKSNIFVEYWIKYVNIFKDLDLISIGKYTKYFDESLTIFYLVIIMSYIHYK